MAKAASLDESMSFFLLSDEPDRRDFWSFCGAVLIGKQSQYRPADEKET